MAEPSIADLRRSARARRSVRWSSRSAAAPTPRSSRGSPTTRSGADACARGHRGLAVAGAATSAPTARRWPSEWGLRWTRGRDRRAGATPPYVANDGDRCYHCKAELMDVAGAAGRGRRRRRSCSASTSTTSATTARASGRRPSGARRSRWSTPASPRPTCAPRRASSACARGTSRRPRAWRRRVPVRHAGHARGARAVERAEAGLRARSASASCACATTATWPGIELPVDELPRAVERRRRGRRGGAGRGLPLRDPRPRGLPLGQPNALL